MDINVSGNSVYVYNDGNSHAHRIFGIQMKRRKKRKTNENKTIEDSYMHKCGLIRNDSNEWTVVQLFSELTQYDSIYIALLQHGMDDTILRLLHIENSKKKNSAQFVPIW